MEAFTVTERYNRSNTNHFCFRRGWGLYAILYGTCICACIVSLPLFHKLSYIVSLFHPFEMKCLLSIMVLCLHQITSWCCVYTRLHHGAMSTPDYVLVCVIIYWCPIVCMCPDLLPSPPPSSLLPSPLCHPHIFNTMHGLVRALQGGRGGGVTWERNGWLVRQASTYTLGVGGRGGGLEAGGGVDSWVYVLPFIHLCASFGILCQPLPSSITPHRSCHWLRKTIRGSTVL